MTIQNAPPGLDYDRDKKFSKVLLFFPAGKCRCKLNVHHSVLVCSA